MGRTPRPVKLKLLNGRRPGKDSGGRSVAQSPAFRRLPPAKPSTLSALAAQHWDAIVPELVRLELLKSIDIGSLTLLCETWARWQEANRIISKEGQTVTSPQGVKRHPALLTAESAEKAYRAWATEFGLTPSAEARLKPVDRPTDDDNPFA